MNLNKVIEELLAEIEQLKEENKKLKEELNQSDYVKASIFSDREEYKNQIIELKTKLYNAKVKEQRLIKILNETDDYT